MPRHRPSARQLAIGAAYLLVLLALDALAMLTADRSALAYVAMALATMPLSLIGYIGGYALALAVGPLDPRLDTIIGFTWWAFIGVGQAALGLFVATKRSETRAQRISY